MANDVWLLRLDLAGFPRGWETYGKFSAMRVLESRAHSADTLERGAFVGRIPRIAVWLEYGGRGSYVAA